MPPLFQGTVVRPTEPRNLNLEPPLHIKGEVHRQNIAFLAQLNREHLPRHPGEADLEARIASYELAAAKPDSVSYAAIFKEHNLVERVKRDDVGESWVWGAPYFGTDEYAMKIPGDQNFYGTDNPWFYRPYDSPDCGRGCTRGLPQADEPLRPYQVAVVAGGEIGDVLGRVIQADRPISNFDFHFVLQ